MFGTWTRGFLKNKIREREIKLRVYSIRTDLSLPQVPSFIKRSCLNDLQGSAQNTTWPLSLHAYSRCSRDIFSHNIRFRWGRICGNQPCGLHTIYRCGTTQRGCPMTKRTSRLTICSTNLRGYTLVLTCAFSICYLPARTHGRWSSCCTITHKQGPRRCVRPHRAVAETCSPPRCGGVKTASIYHKDAHETVWVVILLQYWVVSLATSLVLLDPTPIGLSTPQATLWCTARDEDFRLLCTSTFEVGRRA